MTTFTAVFCALVLLSVVMQAWLIRRNMSHVETRRDAVPAAFRDQITLADHQKAADYTLTRNRLGLLEVVWGAILLLAWTVGGGLELLDRAWRSLGWSETTTGIGVFTSALLLMGILDLPFSAWHTFSIERRFGFNRTTVGMFISDLVKQLLVSTIIGIPLLWLVLTLMDVSGPSWWLYVWCVWIGFTLLMMWAWPRFIAPLFNSFQPLQDRALHDRIDALLDRCGFRSSGIFVMDGSRRSGHGNAYFTGIGNNKRIVFFDTLLESLDPPEIEAVLAHELGHFRLRHIQKRLLSTAVVSLVSLGILGWLIDHNWFYNGLGVTTPSTYMGLLLFFLAGPVIMEFLQPVFSAISRKHEFEADSYATQQAEAGDLVRALVKLYRENASTLTPDPLYSAFHDSHPPAPVRINHLSAKIGNHTEGASG